MNNMNVILFLMILELYYDVKNNYYTNNIQFFFCTLQNTIIYHILSEISY